MGSDLEDHLKDGHQSEVWLRSVRVTRVGDTDFLTYHSIDEQVDCFRFMEENEKVMNRGGEPADGTPLLLGITKPP